MLLGVALLLSILTPLTTEHPVFTIERSGTTYSLNSGLCESFSCGSDEGRGACTSEIYRGRPAHFCRCNLPFTGAFCDETLQLNASLPSSLYADCPQPLYCASVYGNGVCNQECNSRECLYDGYACLLQESCPQEEYCRERFSDGICDDACNREECEFDGGDCFGELDTLPGQLMIRLSMSVQEFMPLSHLFLFQLSRFLRATVVLSQDSMGPLVWQWSAVEGRGTRIARGENSSRGIEVAFSVDLTRCTTDCFDSIGRVVEFIDHALSSKSVPLSSALSSMVSVSSRPSSLPSLIRSDHLLVSLGLLFLLLSVVVGVALQQRASRKRTLEAPIWFPPAMGEVAMDVIPLKKARPSPTPSLLHQQAAGDGPMYITDSSDVNGRDDRGRTPLLLLLQSTRKDMETLEIVRALVRTGADIKAIDTDGWGALHFSLHRHRTPAFNQKLIEMGANPQVVDVRGRSVIHLATEYCDLLNLEMMLQSDAVRMIDTADDRNRTPLSMAVADCQLAVARVLVDAGANLDSDGDEQFDPSIVQRFPLHCAVMSNNKEHAKLLIDRGCLLAVRDSRRRTPLHYAVLYADIGMCRMLVDAGVPVAWIDDEDRTAESISEEWKMTEVHQYLVSVRGQNEPPKKRNKKKTKRYSSDQGYGSEESRRAEEAESETSHGSTRDPTPLPTLVVSPPLSFGLPNWAAGAQLQMFHTTPFTPLATFPAASTDALYTPYQQVLTPSHHLLHGSLATPTHMQHGSTMSLQQSALLPNSYLTPL
ncbi:hypothetical protein PFISCL1PPCAC_16162 [Pristionchus fissidentatus]|uniref:LNR domain-containing protein n=1 Tax=Pristionchus fissidentatus TaxID=1538716 RepID=A0AAV5W2C9_9BILA|nr:hypothetical protein PFISCL1PPCAC_16162 [Pristionchus fissidentatus]